jgi:Cdc6-like AAA superfamily ATPase
MIYTSTIKRLRANGISLSHLAVLAALSELKAEGDPNPSYNDVCPRAGFARQHLDDLAHRLAELGLVKIHLGSRGRGVSRNPNRLRLTSQGFCFIRYTILPDLPA